MEQNVSKESKKVANGLKIWHSRGVNTKIPLVIIDCDPGADDFFALLWALGLHKK
jgi:hypothetical protein